MDFHCQYYRKRISLSYAAKPSSILSQANTKPCRGLGERTVPRPRKSARATRFRRRSHRETRRFVLERRSASLCRRRTALPRRGLPDRRPSAPRSVPFSTDAPNAEGRDTGRRRSALCCLTLWKSTFEGSPDSAPPCAETSGRAALRRHALRISAIS